jgi:hypothetical protein
MGENIGQLGSSARLIAEKCAVVYQSLKALRRLDVSAFAHWVNRGFIKRNTKFAAQLTLEVNFAIAPSVNDIYSAINVLQNPVKASPLYGRASIPFYERLSASPFARNWTSDAKVSTLYGCYVEVSNPNLYLATSMGLINPAQIAWQLLPGSFLLDWFIPVEEFLGYGTDFYGLTLTGSYTTSFVKGYYNEVWPFYNIGGLCSFFSVRRVGGIVLPSLALRPLKVPSMKRAANAASLVVQAFYK